jgi:hypothetical protein
LGCGIPARHGSVVIKYSSENNKGEFISNR